ncbi:N-acetylmuramoyl-L-alanine amidase [Clostridium estertheticum]|uniref:peptidoglycan-binding protein n=1 Tax=Clostridium estertheticum TaxID=238834 RepID=UPI001CF5F2BC|nr:N-acetylmuramoyl-L-alanine amidase [Clostridium estertheticum]MCB2308886.1 N-acetylmuramoyl-L-alanine amidase [Clostridium estertheticum]MCB2347298.1 N-acetylmuramoyl-L-alanine amidase [Clostridium estertheticum]MCB2351935.1 N-acetylmuramoyl-L-alanine amidase [Clostridium estertheticum]WAG48500.1 N-acetylmuramoyl-L-alanine amidase [Clostridium estertheticum]
MSKPIIGVRGGHSPNCTGANGYLNEQAEVRKISYKLMENLRKRGYTVVDCNSNAGNVNAELNEGTYKARNCDIYLPLHMNDAENKNANGVECWCYGPNSTKAIQIGNNINRNLASLKLQNRGVKFDAGLHDTNSVKGQTCLIELLFCGNKGDSDIYIKVGIDRIVELLAQSIDGNITGNSTPSAPTPKTPAPSKPSQPTQVNTGNDWIRRLQAECNRQGFSNQKVDGYFGENTVNGCPMMKPGATGNLTRLLQEKLNKLTYNTNGIDGIYGSTTRNAVYNYQNNHHLSADGICGKGTWREIIKQ